MLCGAALEEPHAGQWQFQAVWGLPEVNSQALDDLSWLSHLCSSISFAQTS